MRKATVDNQTLELRVIDVPMTSLPQRLACTMMVSTLTAFFFAWFAFSLVHAEDGDLGNANTAEGSGALATITTGTNNAALGANALNSTTTTSWNTATGAQALKNNIGRNNTADGFQALVNNTTGENNTATGFQALFHNTTANENTATGFQALNSNTTGTDNTAIGSTTLRFNTTGNFNTADGFAALESNTTASNNTAVGDLALVENTTGFNNTAVGDRALELNMTSTANTAVGASALLNHTAGDRNTAIGSSALNNFTGSSNIAVGSGAGLNLDSGSNNIVIGNAGNVGESGTIRIGDSSKQSRTFIASIRGITTVNANAIPVVIDSAGQLGTVSSSRRFKDDIKPMGQASEAILALKPVTFRYKNDATRTPQFGLIAEDVAKVNPDLVVRDENGEIYTVRYDAVNAMLLNEFLKEHRKVQKQEARIAQLNSMLEKQETIIARQQEEFDAIDAGQQQEIKALAANVKEQAAQIQKASAQLRLSKPAPRTVLNNQ